jgi:DNA-directed RNA polymerase specialized sigma24 family protein
VKKLIERLRDPSLSEIAEKKLDEYTDEEVAKAMNLDVSTVKRKVREIGVLWEKWT